MKKIAALLVLTSAFAASQNAFADSSFNISFDFGGATFTNLSGAQQSIVDYFSLASNAVSVNAAGSGIGNYSFINQVLNISGSAASGNPMNSSWGADFQLSFGGNVASKKLVTVTIPYTYSLTASNGDSSSVSFGASLGYAAGLTNKRTEDSTQLIAGPTQTMGYFPDSSGSGEISLILKNTSNSNADFYGAMSFVGAANAVAAPVPEPETYALLIAGLGVLSAVLRRRKRADQQ